MYGMKKSMRMKAMDEMMKDKPAGLEQMRKKKMQSNLESAYKDLMEPSGEQIFEMKEDESLPSDEAEDDEMDYGEGEKGFVAMPVSPDEKKMILAYRKRMSMDEEEIA